MTLRGFFRLPKLRNILTALSIEQTPEAVLQELANLTGMPVLCIYHDKDDEVNDINRDCADKVRSLLTSIPETGPLCVLVDSPGGYTEHAYRIVLAMRGRASSLQALVPREAKSAATLICLGADRILMGQSGELGPLDPQFEDPAGSVDLRSALETFQGLLQLRGYSTGILDTFITFFREEERLDAPHCYEQSVPLFASVVSPLYQQVNPHELGRYGRYLAVNEEYAKRVMERWGYADRDEEDIENIAHDLTWGYPEHGFVIDLKEAQDLGLLAEKLDGETERLCHKLFGLTKSYTNIASPRSWLPTDRDTGAGQEGHAC